MGENRVEALRGIDLTIHEQDLLSIMGQSGSGKSTMMNIIGILDRPTEGEYLLNGKDVSKLSDNDRATVRNRHVGFVFQSFFLLPRLSAIANVGLPLMYRGTPHHEIKERSAVMLEKVGIGHLSHHKPYELSGGQQQRVAVARALVGNPSILLADEPTGALDTKTSQDVMDLFISLNKDDGTTIIIITHDPKIGKQCRRQVWMEDGQIISDGVG